MCLVLQIIMTDVHDNDVVLQDPRAILLCIAELTDVPEAVMMWLIDLACVLETMHNIPLVPSETIHELAEEYMHQCSGDSGLSQRWPLVVTNRLIHLVQWFVSYAGTFSKYPNPTKLSRESLHILPENLLHDLENQACRFDAHTSHAPGGQLSSSTNQQSNIYTDSQVTNRYNKKASMTDYPKFSGLAEDWITFAHKFTSVASSQGYGYILQANEFQPTTSFERTN